MKNLKALLTNVALIVIGVLMFVFMSQAYMTVTAKSAFGSASNSGSGFDTIEFGGESREELLAISNVFVCVFVGLIIVIAIINLLISFGVIKNAKLAKILGIANVVLAALTVVFAVCAIGSLGSLVADTNKLSIPGVSMSATASIGWACILNLILSVATLAIAGYSFLTARKAK